MPQGLPQGLPQGQRRARASVALKSRQRPPVATDQVSVLKGEWALSANLLEVAQEQPVAWWLQVIDVARRSRARRAGRVRRQLPHDEVLWTRLESPSDARTVREEEGGRHMRGPVGAGD